MSYMDLAWERPPEYDDPPDAPEEQMHDTLLNITCCYNPAPGSPKSRDRLCGADSAEWLEKSVRHYAARYGLPIAVSISGFPGIALTEGGRERDAYYRIFNMTRFLAVPVNPSHQLGASLTMKMGMEYAAACGFTYLVQTAEDLIPRKGSLEAKIEAIHRNYDFVGGIGDLDPPSMPSDQHQWIRQTGPRLIGAGCQLFACRVAAFANSWDAGAVRDCIEIHMGNFISRLRYLCLAEEYDHSHNYSEWLDFEKRHHEDRFSIPRFGQI
jgi:hypothetical protein